MALSRAMVVDAALTVLENQGLDALTLRAVAGVLGVQHNTVRWHVGGRAELLALTADRLFAKVADEPLPEAPADRLMTVFTRVYRSLLSFRGGARLVAGVTDAGPNTLHFAETSVAALLKAGLSPKEAAWLYWTMWYYVLGLSVEQDAHPGLVKSDLAEALSSGRFPALSLTEPHLMAGDFDERLNFGLKRLLGPLK